MKKHIVITGATGNVGYRIAAKLLSAGEPVRVIARERVRLGPLAAKGAEPWPGDIGDAAFLAKAFAGARAVFAMIPPRHDAPDFRGYQDRIADALEAGVRRAGVPRVVTLSSLGAHLSEGTGPILGLRDLEKKLHTLGDTAVIHLRPAFFMENFLGSISSIRERGAHETPVRPDVPIPMIAAKDIASAAAGRLSDDSFSGRAVLHLLGPRDLTMAEATRILGEAIGIPGLGVVTVPEEEARRGMTAAGMSASAALAMLEMIRGFNAGRIRAPEERNAMNTTPTTLEEFAREVFAPAFRAAA